MERKNFKLREYQKEIVENGYQKIKALKIVYLSLEVRTGKTIISLSIAEKLKVKKVLFITKKKVVLSNTIHNDYNLVDPSYQIIITNYESVHKIDTKEIDLVIVDEAHSLGAFPKPSLRTKRLKEIIGNKFLILLSGTPTPESFSQLYHQLFISEYSPFKERSFYAWARTYVDVKKRYVAHGNQVNDYSNANEKLIKEVAGHLFISFTQKEAGFKTKVQEEVLYVEMNPITNYLINKVKNDLVVEGRNGGVILADTPVKLQQKVHQLCSGTCKLEDGGTAIIDDSKAVFIKEHFKGKKIGIFYKFVAELELLKQVFQEDITTDLEEFNNSDKNIALQIVSGREGISLKEAHYLVYFNIDFSSTSYFQSKDRMTTKERKYNKVYWIFSKGGIEEKIYKAVQNKKNYTLNYFKRDYERSKIPA